MTKEQYERVKEITDNLDILNALMNAKEIKIVGDVFYPISISEKGYTSEVHQNIMSFARDYKRQLEYEIETI